MIPIKYLLNKPIFLSLLMINLLLLLYPVNTLSDNFGSINFYKKNDIKYINFHENKQQDNSFYILQGGIDTPQLKNSRFLMHNSEVNYSFDSKIINYLSLGKAVILSSYRYSGSQLSFKDRLTSISYNIPYEQINLLIYPFEKPRPSSTLVILPEIYDLLTGRETQLLNFETEEDTIIVQDTIIINEVIKDINNENYILILLLLFLKIIEIFLLATPLSIEFNFFETLSKDSGGTFFNILGQKYSYYALNGLIPMLIINLNTSALIFTFPLFIFQVALLLIFGFLITQKSWRI
jgi:hypothetical protein